MKYTIEFTQRAANHIRALKKFEQQKILDTIEQHLQYEPTKETRNRKHLGQNDVADWELRIGNHRVFYDVIIEENQQRVKIKAVGYKIHNTLYIEGKEITL